MLETADTRLRTPVVVTCLAQTLYYVVAFRIGPGCRRNSMYTVRVASRFFFFFLNLFSNLLSTFVVFRMIFLRTDEGKRNALREMPSLRLCKLQPIYERSLDAFPFGLIYANPFMQMPE